eukprot:GHVU01025209.1.p2 GENE.GHVU01025209.1~~GHVU01025209.1.p2  ORF type:complete len:118 (+),score=4.28 GHVU01025209.1:65-418(+)
MGRGEPSSSSSAPRSSRKQPTKASYSYPRKHNAKYSKRYFEEYGVLEVQVGGRKRYECRLCFVDRPEKECAKTGSDGLTRVHKHTKVSTVPFYYNSLRKDRFGTQRASSQYLHRFCR